jgi:hypothetical protein
MKTKSTSSDWHIDRPFVVLGRTFAVLALLFCVATPFTDDPEIRWPFLLGGLGYSAFLAFFVIGIFLLPQTWLGRVSTALGIAGPFAALAPITLMAVVYFQLPPSIIDYGAPPFLWAGCGFIAVTLGFACYGWYHRVTRSTRKVP